MRVLIINKFLYPNGGSETYIFKLNKVETFLKERVNNRRVNHV